MRRSAPLGCIPCIGGTSIIRVFRAIVTKSDTATVLSVSELACSGLETDVCREVKIRLESGENDGAVKQLMLDDGTIDPDVDAGDELRVVRNVVPPGGDRIGLIAAVPITTALACVLARRMSESELAAVEPHGHSH